MSRLHSKEVAKMRAWKLDEVNYGAAGRLDYELAVLPIGATEAHGLHLPYGTDTFQVEAVAERACELAAERGAKPLLLPAMPYGVNENTLGFPWTISLPPSTLFAFVADVVSSVEEHGIQKFVLLNGHGGNEFKPLLRELFRRTSVHMFLVEWWNVASEVAAEIFEEGGEHANEMETSLVLHLRPELVDSENMGHGRTKPSRLTAVNEGWAWIARPWHLLTEDSGVGDPAAASAEKGARFLEAVAERVCSFLVELSAAEIDNTFPYEAGPAKED
jgi:creatinine amidohydrolase